MNWLLDQSGKLPRLVAGPE